MIKTKGKMWGDFKLSSKKGSSVNAKLLINENKRLKEENKSFKKTIEILKDKNLTKNLSKAYREFKENKGYSEKEVFGHLD